MKLRGMILLALMLVGAPVYGQVTPGLLGPGQVWGNPFSAPGPAPAKPIFPSDLASCPSVGQFQVGQGTGMQCSGDGYTVFDASNTPFARGAVHVSNSAFNTNNQISFGVGTGPNNAGNAITMLYQNGTAASPTAVLNGNELGFVQLYAWDGSAFSSGNPPAWVFFATENWTPSAHGAVTFFQGVPNGTTVAVNEVSIGNGLSVMSSGGGRQGLGQGTLTVDNYANIGPQFAVNSGVKLTVNANTVAVAPPASVGAVAQFSGVNSQNTYATIDTFSTIAATSVWATRRARGTQASFTAVQSGDILGGFTAVGATGANTFASELSSGAILSASATENWSGTNQGTKWSVLTTPNTTATPVVAATFHNSGGFAVGSAAADPGAGWVNSTNGYKVAGSQISCANISGAGTGCSGSAFSNLTGAVTSVGAATSLGSFTSANLLGALTDETGSGSAVFGTSPVLSTVDARGTWTTGTSWTLPAYSLGGTISGGGNQINNVIIGTTTPLAGLFTTLSASTSLTSPLHIGGSGTTGTQLTFQTTSGSGTTDAFAWKRGSNGATTAMTLNNVGLVVGSTANNTGVLLTVSGNAATLQAPPTSAIAQFSAADATPSILNIDSYGTGTATAYSSIAFRRANGTAASPSALQSGDIIALFGGFGRGTTGYSAGNMAQLRMLTSETWSDTAQGEEIEFYITPNTTVSVTRAGKFFNSGGFGIGAAAPDPGIGSLIAVNSIKSQGATAGVGYATGAGGAVTQATSRTTGVTLNTVTGAITLVSAAGTATVQSFTVTNSAVAATDIIKVVQKSGTDLYEIFVTAVAAGSFKISYFTTGGTTTEQPVFNFAIIKGVASFLLKRDLDPASNDNTPAFLENKAA